MWVVSAKGKEINKCRRVFIDENYKVEKKKVIALIGVIDCSTYGEQREELGIYKNIELAMNDLKKVEIAIEDGKNIVAL